MKLQDSWSNPYSENTFLDWDEVPPDSPLAEVLIIWTLEAPVLFLLTLYLDQVMGCLVCESSRTCVRASVRA